jgi:uncharacterized protein (DUF433 family)
VSTLDFYLNEFVTPERSESRRFRDFEVYARDTTDRESTSRLGGCGAIRVSDEGPPKRYKRERDQQSRMSITRDEDTLGGEPRIEGTRVGVRHVAARVVDSDQSPAHVADQLDISLSEVYEALSYYYAHVEEMRAFERENEDAFERMHESSLKPKGTIQ